MIILAKSLSSVSPCLCLPLYFTVFASLSVIDVYLRSYLFCSHFVSMFQRRPKHRPYSSRYECLIILAKYNPIGCFVDKSLRAIPYSGKTFSGPLTIPRCAAIATSKGYQAFGVQYGGQCFTGPEAHVTYAKYGEASDSDCKNGLGGTWRNNIYSFGKA